MSGGAYIDKCGVCKKAISNRYGLCQEHRKTTCKQCQKTFTANGIGNRLCPRCVSARIKKQ